MSGHKIYKINTPTHIHTFWWGRPQPRLNCKSLSSPVSPQRFAQSKYLTRIHVLEKQAGMRGLKSYNSIFTIYVSCVSDRVWFYVQVTLHEEGSETINMDVTVMSIIHRVEFETIFPKGRRPVGVFNKGVTVTRCQVALNVTG
jgi:hypothetical protein